MYTPSRLGRTRAGEAWDRFDWKADERFGPPRAPITVSPCMPRYTRMPDRLRKWNGQTVADSPPQGYGAGPLGPVHQVCESRLWQTPLPERVGEGSQGLQILRLPFSS